MESVIETYGQSTRKPYHSKRALTVYPVSICTGPDRRAADLALFADRLLMCQELPQVYGTLYIYNKEKDSWQLYRVWEPERLNVKRKQLGLSPVEGHPLQQ